LPEIERDAADDAASFAAWQAADNQWRRDNLKPPHQREHFQIAEIAEALARLPGRPEVDAELRRSITFDLYEWIERREFAQEDVLMLVGGSKSWVPFPLDEVLNDATRKLIGNPKSSPRRPVFELSSVDGSVWLNLGAIILTRPAVHGYLDRCGFDGAPRVTAEWFGKAVKPRRQNHGPKPELRNRIIKKMLSDLCSGRRSKEELQSDTIEALAKEYGGSPNTANKARKEALSQFSQMQSSNQ
jgi:hypothetical protein